jgi:hypothetical protein
MSLEELQAAHPRDWSAVRDRLDAVLTRGTTDDLVAAMTIASAPVASRRVRTPSEVREEQGAVVRREMQRLAFERIRFSMATGVAEGKVRFNWVNGWCLQRLFFERDLRRKPVSMLRFRLTWPFAWQRRFLMPLVGPRGIWCFYSKQLVRELAELIGDASCLEIGSGDGSLSRFLCDAGVNVVATDDYSWSSRVKYDQHVVRQDARTALRVRQPKVVICSWPPARNTFEREVFATKSVDTYIVIGTRREGAAGDWASYRRQTHFAFEERSELRRLVLPPEIDPAVYVFRRRRP